MQIHIHIHPRGDIHIHHHGSKEDVELLQNVFSLTKSTHTNTQKIMEQLELHLEALNKIDAATTKAGQQVSVIGDRITNLENTIKNMGLTAEQENQLLTQTQGIADRATQIADALEQMGKTPENPVPVEPSVEGGNKGL